MVKGMVMRTYDHEFIEMALLEASRSDCYQGVGAVLVANGKILAKGRNRPLVPVPYRAPLKTVFGRIFTLHAEMDLLRKLRVRHKPAILYIARNRGGENGGMARPCKRCAKLLEKLPITRIVYTTGGDTLEEVRN